VQITPYFTSIGDFSDSMKLHWRGKAGGQEHWVRPNLSDIFKLAPIILEAKFHFPDFLQFMGKIPDFVKRGLGSPFLTFLQVI